MPEPNARASTAMAADTDDLDLGAIHIVSHSWHMPFMKRNPVVEKRGPAGKWTNYRI